MHILNIDIFKSFQSKTFYVLRFEIVFRVEKNEKRRNKEKEKIRDMKRREEKKKKEKKT